MSRLISFFIAAALCFGQGTALSSAGGGTNVIAWASNTAWNNVSAGTMFAWVNPTSVITTTSRILDKQGTQRLIFAVRDSTNGDLRCGYNRNSVNLNILSTTGYVTTGAWQFLACTWDTSGSNGNQLMYRATLTATALTQPTYSAQAVGSGTHDDSSATVTLGNGNGGSTNSFAGTIAVFGWWNRTMTAGELASQMFTPHASNGCIALFALGRNGTGTQPNLCGTKTAGTVTGFAAAAGVPLAPFFNP